MDDQAAGRAQFGGLLEFIGPPSVIRHGLSAKGLWIELAGILRIRHGRIVDQHDQDLAAHIHAFEIVPVEFRRLNSVTHKDHVGIDRARIHHALSPGHEIGLELRRQGMAVAGEAKRHQRVHGNSDQTHGLQVGSIRIPGF